MARPPKKSIKWKAEAGPLTHTCVTGIKDGRWKMGVGEMSAMSRVFVLAEQMQDHAN